jgi:hypothetical protein
MTRSFFAVALVGLAGLALMPAFLQGCSQTGVGDPCVPEQEYDPTFLGFSAGEVNVESKSFDCETRLCLANHFQGRVTCPYGQPKVAPPALAGPPATQPNGAPYNDKNGNPIGACVLPGGGVDSATGAAPSLSIDGTQVNQAITGTQADQTDGTQVQPWCLGPDNPSDGTSANRSANNAVYCSCRCANTNGQTNDGANYCACPEGFVCQQLVTPIGTTDTGLTGAYCIRSGSAYNSQTACTTAGGFCDASKQNCGAYNGQQ